MWLGAVCFLLFRLDSSKGWWICCFIHNTHLHEGKHIGFFCVRLFHFHNIQIILCLSGCTLKQVQFGHSFEEGFWGFSSSTVWYKKFGENFQNVSKFSRVNTFFQKQIPKFCLKNEKNCPKTIQWSRLANFISSLVFSELIVIGQIEGNDVHIQSANVVLNELHPNYFLQAIILFLVALLLRSLHT